MKHVQFSVGRDSVSGQAASDKPTRPAALCRGETTENMKLEGDEETELNGVGEGQDEMSDEGDRIDGEEELAAPVWRVRAGPRNNPKTRVPFRDWSAPCMMSRGRTHHHVAKQKKTKDQSRRPIIATDYYFMKMKSVANAQTISEESITCTAVKDPRHPNIMSSVALKKGGRGTLDNREGGEVIDLLGYREIDVEKRHRACNNCVQKSCS